MMTNCIPIIFWQVKNIVILNIFTLHWFNLSTQIALTEYILLCARESRGEPRPSPSVLASYFLYLVVQSLVKNKYM